MSLDKAERDYHDNPDFHALVDVMYKLIWDLQFTPSELREAATYAAYRVECRRTRSTIVSNTELGSFKRR